MQQPSFRPLSRPPHRERRAPRDPRVAAFSAVLLLGLAAGACGAQGTPGAVDSTAAWAPHPPPPCPAPSGPVLSVRQTLLAPANQPLLVAGVLCADNTHIPCPPCPEGANCAACLEPDWIFAEGCPIVDYEQTLTVRGLPELELGVGRRYLLHGSLTEPRGLAALSVCDLVP